jgi:hypothetical protein
VDPDTFAVTVLPLAGTLPPFQTTISDAYRTYNARFAYLPEIKCVVFLHRQDTNVYFFRVA